LIVPFPAPGLPDVIASHIELLVADQLQCDGVVTAKLPAPPSLLYVALFGEISSVQAPSPSSWTDTV
jgi:hypothetical protein